MRRALGVLAFLLAGCIDDTVQHCGTVICPVTQVCVDDQRCVGQDAVAACGSAAVADPCTVAGVAGRCADHGSVRVCDPATCGDGVIDTALHEVCDGSAAYTTQCADIGFDLGRPACASDCTFDLGGCTRFGWDRVINASVYSFWTDGTVTAYAQHAPDMLIATGGGYNVSVPQFVDSLGGGGGHIYAISGGVPYEVTKTALVDLAAPFPAGTAVAMAVDGAGVLHVSQQCNVWTYNPVDASWKNPYGSASSCPGPLAVTPDGTLYFATTDVVFVLVGGSPAGQFQTAGVITSLRAASATEIYAATTQGLWEWTGVGSAKQVAYGDVRTLAIVGDKVYAGYADGSALRWDHVLVDKFTPPTASLADDGHGGLYSYTGPVYRYSGMMFGDLAAITLGSPGERITGVVTLSDGTVIATSTFEEWTPNAYGDSWDKSSALSPSASHAIAGSSPGELAIATDDSGGTGANPHVWRQHGGGAWNTYDPPEKPIVDGLAMDSDGTLYAAGYSGTDGFLGAQDGSNNWVQHESDAGCDFHGVDHGVAVGACGGVASIWRLSGTSWSELHREMTIAGALRGVKTLANGDIFAVGDSGAVWFTGGTWAADATIHGRSIDGSEGDLWVAGAFTDVEHWDGHAWTKMTTRALGPEAIAVSPDRVLMPGGGVGHVVLLR